MRINLFTKIYLLALVLGLLTGFILVNQLVHQQSAVMKHELTEQHRVLARLAAQSFIEGDHDQSGTHPEISALTYSDDVFSWVVLRPDLTVAHAKNTQHLNQTLATALPSFAAVTSYDFHHELPASTNPNHILVLEPIPIPDRDPLTLAIVFDTKDYHQLVRSLWITSFSLIGMLFLVFGSVFFFTLRHILTHPLRQLTRGTQILAGGDWSFRLGLIRQDEIGQLAGAFNHLAAQLQSTTVSREYLRDIMESLSDPLFLANEQGQIVSLNQAACQLLGYEEAELQGQPLRLITPQLSWPLSSLSPTDPSVDQAGVRNRETVLLAQNQRSIPVLFSASIIHDRTRHDAPLFVCTAKDISQRKSTEEQLRLVSVQAQAANVAKSAFLANMSHEIRTPMTAILGFADLLRDPHQTPADRHNCLQTIRRNGQHLLTIINDVLDLSKIEAGRMTIESLPCWPSQLVSEVVAMLRPRADEKNLSLDIHYAFPLPAVIQSDPVRLRQILLNLLGNAIKYTPSGAVTITLHCPDLKSTHPQLVMDISDTGVGIDPEKIPLLFLPFNQANSASSRSFGGSGLGLAISHRLAHMLGGDLTVSSQAGQGSTFSLSLPTGALQNTKMLLHPGDLGRSPTLERQHVQKAPAPRLKARILLAEDGPDNQALIAFYLQHAGAQVALANNGQEAYEAALDAWHDGHPFDLILMDMQMPLLDGYEATGKLREENYTGSIIALTAHAMAADREKCLQAGCDDYLAKPVDRQTLLSTIAALLQQQEAQSAPLEE